ncbi:MAG: PA domain-containing protein [Dehalococcoidales bacterium]
MRNRTSRLTVAALLCGFLPGAVLPGCTVTSPEVETSASPGTAPDNASALEATGTAPIDTPPDEPAGTPPEEALRPPVSSPASPSSPRLNVVGHLDLGAGPENITDVWALATADGRSYAYLGTSGRPACDPEFTGVHIVDISDPATPQPAGFIPSPPGTSVNDVKAARLVTPFFSGDLLAHSLEACAPSPVAGPTLGVSLHDVTEPLAPRLLAEGFLSFQVHNLFIYQQGERAFILVVEDDAERDFHLVEITDPTAPRELATLGWPDWFDVAEDQLFLGNAAVSQLHDVWAETYPAGVANARFAGRTIAFLPYWDAGLVLLDITDPAAPVFLGDSDYLDPDPVTGRRPEGNSHAAVPADGGRLVFMGDEDFSTAGLHFTVESGDFAGEYPAVEAAFTTPLESLSGPTTFVGVACAAEGLPAPASEMSLALIERGVCPFEDKIANAAAAGYQAAVVFNQVDEASRLIPMSGSPAKGVIPAVFVTRFTAFAILGMSPESDPETPLPQIGVHGEQVSAEAGIFDGWGYGRVLDVTDPADIVELGQFAVDNVLVDPPPPGDHSMHNVVVDGTVAYISWYADGIRVVDFHHPEAPVETAHFVDAESGSDFWGVYLFRHPDGNRYILGSDRSTGLWIFAVP